METVHNGGADHSELGSSGASNNSKMETVREKLLAFKPDEIHPFPYNPNLPRAFEVSPFRGQVSIIRHKAIMGHGVESAEIFDTSSKQVLLQKWLFNKRVGSWDVYPLFCAGDENCLFFRVMTGINSVNQIWTLSASGEVQERCGYRTPDFIGRPLAHVLLDGNSHLGQVRNTSWKSSERRLGVVVCHRNNGKGESSWQADPSVNEKLAPYKDGHPVHVSVLRKEEGDRMIVGMNSVTESSPMRVWSVGVDGCEELKLPEALLAECVSLKGLVAKEGKLHLIAEGSGNPSWILLFTSIDGKEFSSLVVDTRLSLKGALDCPGLRDSEVLVHAVGGSIHVLNTETGEVSIGAATIEEAGSFHDLRAVEDSGSVYLIGDLRPSNWEFKPKKMVFKFTG